MNYDIVVIGLGIRGMSFLAQNQHILNYKILIIDDNKHLGTGKLANYIVKSHSDCSGLISYFDSPLFENKKLSKLLVKDEPIYLNELKDTLIECGQKLKLHIGEKNVLQEKVTSIKKQGDTYNIISEKGKTINTKMVILSTGMKEYISPNLAALKNKVILSGNFLDGNNLRQNTQQVKNKNKIIVYGASHSAISCVQLLMRIFDDLKASPEVLIIHRNPFIVRYENIQEAQLYKNEQNLRKIKSTEDSVCRSSGKVFRQSGLKGDSKDLIIDIVQGKLKNIKTLQTNDKEKIKEHFFGADLIIQSIGYYSDLPQLEFSKEHQDTRIPKNINSTIDGLTDFENIFSVRMIRTPMGDNRLDQEDLYKKIGREVSKKIVQLNLQASA